MHCRTMAIVPVFMVLLALAPLGDFDSKPKVAKAEAIKQELKRMAGRWKLVFEGAHGQTRRRNEGDIYAGKQFWLTIWEDGSSRVEVEGEKRLGPKLKYVIDPTARPKILDLVFPPNKQGQETVTLGIYELDGDELNMCFASDGHPRPTDFTFPPGRFREVWRRVKDKK